MAGVDENGLTIKRLPDILSEFQAAIKAQYGNDTPVDANSFFGIFNTIYGASDAEVWELLQTLNNQFSPNTAYDKWLDDIAAYLKITRLQPTASKGELSLFGNSGTVIPVGTEFSDLNGAVYQSTTEGILDTGTSRTPIAIGTTNGTGITGESSTLYTITINGDTYNAQTYWPNVQLEDVALSFKNSIGDQPNYYVESYTELNPEFIIGDNPPDGGNKGTILNIINKNAVIPITITTAVTQSPIPEHYQFSIASILKSNTISTFSDFIEVEATLVGSIDTPVNTLTAIETPVVGLDSVYNQNSMVIGRDLETDEELRERMKQDGAINSYATEPAIKANLRQVEGVSFVDIQVNKSYVTDTEGRPPNSYECVVIGGDEEDIAKTILNRGAAGIEPHGNTSVTIDDDDGNPQVIKFSRAVEEYIWLKLYYTKNTEEVFPDNGTELMTTSALEYGEDLNIGADVIPKRFFGSVYSSTTGIEDLVIKVAKSSDPVVEPAISEFSVEKISIPSDSVSSFADYRIEVIED